MDEEEIEKTVIAYLKKKGFKQTELAFQEEHKQNKRSSSLSNANYSSASSQTGPHIAKHALPFPQFSESVSEKYHDGYIKLRSWADTSLDLYKIELLRVLYPVFIHCFMDLVAKGHVQEARSFFNSFREDHEMTHSRDLQKLEGVLSPSHLEEMEFAHSLRHSKVSIRMCQYSYDLLLQYLHKPHAIVMLGMINEHVNFQVSPPGLVPDDDGQEVDIVTGIGSETAGLVNQKEVHWGILEDSLEEKAGGLGLLSDSEKVGGESKEGEMDEKKMKSVEGGKQGGGSSMKKGKKEKVEKVKPELPLPAIDMDVEQSILEDLRNRVHLNSLSLPSVNMYTFLNTQNALNCVSISHDGSLVAGGFSDSSLKLWDMANPQRKCYTSLHGHSGPVYSSTFSPCGDFLLSSSSDSTVRLWSTKFNANLVCYKGHNYPVWDVQFSPVGHYFASASHDRTARLWSMDRTQPLRIMAGHLSDVDCVQWHSNCNYIATGSSDKTVRLWDVQRGECVRIFIGHRSMVLSMAMSPDGRYMASGDEDGKIMVWDLGSGQCLTPLVGHTSCVWTLAFSCEGSLLASGSADCTVKLWDLTKMPKPDEKSKSGSINRLRSLKTLPTKSTPVYALRFSRRNLLFAAGAFSSKST
ncbi:unnamed protein product [Cuscuta campestris]|uniref:TFIID subunit TAF5 NTD2 domain-containing protein n=1 Tax=Cuscuta campestris TaxID=132261 RepID=A0A484LYP7_9ASTE|nr:unnamed protein product [Cuscuta campestris]